MWCCIASLRRRRHWSPTRRIQNTCASSLKSATCALHDTKWITNLSNVRVTLGNIVPSSTEQIMNILGLSGSLRAASYNSLALKAAQKLAPPGITVDIASIADIPLYNDDVRAQGEPASVTAMKAKVRQADAVLIATPEYNFSIPGVLKNMLDWMSRPPEPPFAGKVVGIIGASPGPVGTGRVQYDLRKVMVFLDAFTVNKPEVMINNCSAKFDAQGHFIDEAGEKFIVDLLRAMQSLKQRLG